MDVSTPRCIDESTRFQSVPAEWTGTEKCVLVTQWENNGQNWWQDKEAVLCYDQENISSPQQYKGTDNCEYMCLYNTCKWYYALPAS